MRRARHSRRPRVLIVWRSLLHYRVPFFNQLRQQLGARGIELEVAHGQPTTAEALRRDGGDLPWGTLLSNRIVPLRNKEVIWQPCIRRAAHADLVVVEQAARLLANYPLLAMQSLGIARIAFWGHGGNLNSSTLDARADWLSRRVSRYPHWWFAYTEGAKDRVAALGYPRERVTVVQNAVDTRALQTALAAIRDEDVAAFRYRHGLGDGPVGVYVGSLYRGKRLAFLLQAAELIAKEIPGFRLVIIGDGPDQSSIRQATLRSPWLRYLGADFDTTRLLALATAHVALLPGLVGLAILDAFAAGLPVVVASGDHGPEIEYLQQGVNGKMVEDSEDPVAYASAVLQLLKDTDQCQAMTRAARAVAGTHTIEAMVERFSAGVETALD